MLAYNTVMTINGNTKFNNDDIVNSFSVLESLYEAVNRV